MVDRILVVVWLAIATALVIFITSPIIAQLFWAYVNRMQNFFL